MRLDAEKNPFKRTKSFNRVTSVRKKTNIWRSISISNIVNYPRTRKNSSVLSSRNTEDVLDDGMESNDSKVSAVGVMSIKLENKVSGFDHNSIVTIVLIEAKGLPPVPEDGVTHKLFCKFRLGSEIYKSKAVACAVHPEWGERFVLRPHKDDCLKISIWDKGKQKIFMGSCILDLSFLERERTHEIWKQLDDRYGLIHLSITICFDKQIQVDNYNNSPLNPSLSGSEGVEQTQYTYDLGSTWQVVGSLQVNIFGARGLDGKPVTYCILELDNERVRTPKEGPSSEPTWNKSYVFSVSDITSTLYLKLYSRSYTNALLFEPIGKVSIPLLMVTNGEERWYALKDGNKRYTAKGNCPRVRLQMTLIWNPIKASLRVFRPKPVQYVKKSKKYDVALVYNNIEFIGKLFNFIYETNESFKRLFEWNDPEYSILAVCCWIVFCFYFRLWTVPLLLLLPFTYHWLCYRVWGQASRTTIINSKSDKSLSGKLQDVQQTTVSVTNGIEYIASVTERLHNLVSFKVPFLSYLAMLLLGIASLIFYFIPFNYLLMALGIYKYSRKYLNPDRVLNNDLIDFLSRIPDDKILMDWKILSVPEPSQKQTSSKLTSSIP